MKRYLPLRRFYEFSIALALLLASCSGSGTQEAAYARIDAPVDNVSVPLGQTLDIEGQAFDPSGVAYVEIWINNELAWTLDDLTSSEDSVSFFQPWTPEEAGNYSLRAIAYGNEGESSDSAFVTVFVAAPPEDEEIIPTDQPTQEGAATVEFRADPEAIEAGDCSILSWDVENAQRVVLGSTEVSARDTFEACPCQTSRYRLIVTDLNGAEDEFWVSIAVSGICVTPTPFIDTTRPPIPLQLSPIGGVQVSPPRTRLRWEEVTDESGILEYRVVVQRHDGDGIWEDVEGSVFYGITIPELQINIESGYTYQWRVRAIDGAGIRSNWSEYATFSVP